MLGIGLPGGGGLLLLDRLRGNLRARRIPIIVITAQAISGLEAKARSQGAEAFLQKPVEKEVLMDMIRRVLGTPPPQQI